MSVCSGQCLSKVVQRRIVLNQGQGHGWPWLIDARGEQRLEQFKKIGWFDESHFLSRHMAGRVHLRMCLGNTWHQNTLWEEGKPMEAVSWFGQYTATKTSCPGNHVEVTSKCTTYLRSRHRIAFRENGVTPYSHRPLSAGWCALLQNKNSSGIVLETQQHVRGVDLT